MSSRADFRLDGEAPQHYGSGAALGYVWDVATLSWVKETQPGGGGGGAVTVADGADVAEGSTADAAWVSGNGTVISLLKKIASAGGSAVSIADGADVAEGTTTDAAVITDVAGTVAGKLRGLVKWAFERMPAALGQTTMANSLPVVLPANQTIGVSILTSPLDVQQNGAIPWGVTDAGGSLTVDGVFFQATQPVSAAALPLPAGAATSALQTQPGVDIGDVTVNNAAGAAAVNIQDGGNSITVDGTVGVSGSVAVTGPLTDTQLRATAVPVSGTVSTKTDLTPSAPAAATVGISSAQAVAANANRKGLALVNVSNNRISLGFGQTAVLDSGVTLYPGGSFEMDEFCYDLGAVNAIASAASSPLAIQEFA